MRMSNNIGNNMRDVKVIEASGEIKLRSVKDVMFHRTLFALIMSLLIIYFIINFDNYIVMNNIIVNYIIRIILSLISFRILFIYVLSEFSSKVMTPGRDEAFLKAMQKTIDRVSPDDITQFENSKKVLELGCAFGSYLNVIQELCPQADLFGIDIKMPREFWGPRNAFFATYDGKRLPFDDNYFDASFVVTVLHHIPDNEFALKELVRVTKPGGFVFVIEDVLVSQMQTKITFLWDSFWNHDWFEHPPHTNRYHDKDVDGMKSWLRCFKETNLKVLTNSFGLMYCNLCCPPYTKLCENITPCEKRWDVIVGFYLLKKM